MVQGLHDLIEDRQTEGGPIFRCACGQWRAKLPDVGRYGRTTHDARIAALRDDHAAHETAARRKR
jgi:hypothetical protein